MAWEFDNAFIVGTGPKPDLSGFTISAFGPGRYSVDVFVNDQWRGRYVLQFNRTAGGDLASCYSRDMLEQYGINTRRLNARLAAVSDYCGAMKAWRNSPDVSEKLNDGALRLDIRVPQLYQYEQDANYVPPSQWQTGVPALNLGYRANYYSQKNKSDGIVSSTDSLWLGLDARASIGKWMLEHSGNFNWRNDEGSHYTSNRTALKRHLPAMYSLFTGGQFFSDSQMFDGLNIIGAGLQTQDAMRPDSTLNWAPVIRGVAETNARVTVSQGGRIIHQATVPPGPFAFDSLYPPNNGSDLLVSIQEADGRVRTFSIPYSSTPQLLRPGISRYALALGKIDEEGNDKSPVMGQTSYQYGFNNTFTFYGGATGYEDYLAGLIGVGMNTRIGALALDITQARTRLPEPGNRHGQRYRLTFNRTLPGLQTALWLQGYYNTRGFYGQRTALDKLDERENGWVLQEKQHISASLNQPLAEGFGSLWLSASVTRYWNTEENYRQYSAGYSNQWGNISWSLTAQRVWNEQNDRSVRKDDKIALTLNWYIPKDKGYLQLTSDTFTSNGKFDSTRIGISGSPDAENTINWGVNTGVRRGGEGEFGLNAGWRSPVTRMEGSWSQGEAWHQGSVSLNGSIIAHPGGVTFSPERGDTLALIEARDAKGAHINGAPGITVDRNGYAVMPWLNPWRINEVTIDPKGSAENIRFSQTRAQVAPYMGSVIVVKFDTKVKNEYMLQARQISGKALPFGAGISDETGKDIGFVGQGSVLYIDGRQAKQARVKWDGGQCTVALQPQEAVCR